MAKLTLKIEVDDNQQAILNNDLLDINQWVQDAMTGKQADFVKLITARSDYKTRKQRDAESSIGE